MIQIKSNRIGIAAKGLVLLLLLAMNSDIASAKEVVIKPQEYQRALRNPLMGFARGSRPDTNSSNEPLEWPTLARVYVKWNDIENSEADGIDKIRAYCDKAWAGVEKLNYKLIPRVYLHWAKDDEKYWPADLTPGDYSSDKFKRRLVRLIERLGQVWDNDPRVAFVQMGFIGKWGEHHTPDVSPELQKLIGDAFTRSFKNKLVMVRHPWDFRDYRFGVYWDSFAHIQQDYHAHGILKLGDRWKIAPIGGETAYDWGRFREQPGDNPTDTVSDPVHRNYLINLIRQVHCNHLGWVANYDRNNPAAVAGAEEVQKVFGYRFVLDEVRYPDAVQAGQPFEVSFTVRNTGSTPFYYPWPVQLRLLHAVTKMRVWSANFTNVDIRQWLPGDFWVSSQRYAQPPPINNVQGRFTLPANLAQGQYVLALAILDPAGNMPSARFAIQNYITGGYHPIGWIGVGQRPENVELDATMFNDPATDKTLHYLY